MGPLKILGERLQMLRKERNKRQVDIAELIGVTQAHYHRVEKGKINNPTLITCWEGLRRDRRLREEPDQRSRPHRIAPGQRQRKEEKVDSTPAKPPPAPSRGQGHAYLKASPQARPPSPVSKRLFLFWTVHGPFSLFLRTEKEKMGGAKDQLSS